MERLLRNLEIIALTRVVRVLVVAGAKLLYHLDERIAVRDATTTTPAQKLAGPKST